VGVTVAGASGNLVCQRPYILSNDDPRYRCDTNGRWIGTATCSTFNQAYTSA